MAFPGGVFLKINGKGSAKVARTLSFITSWLVSCCDVSVCITDASIVGRCNAAIVIKQSFFVEMNLLA